MNKQMFLFSFFYRTPPFGLQIVIEILVFWEIVFVQIIMAFCGSSVGLKADFSKVDMRMKSKALMGRIL